MAFYGELVAAASVDKTLVLSADSSATTVASTPTGENKSDEAVFTVGGRPVPPPIKDEFSTDMKSMMDQYTNSIPTSAVDRRRQREQTEVVVDESTSQAKGEVTSFADSAHCFRTKESGKAADGKVFRKAFGVCIRQGCGVHCNANPLPRDCIGNPNVKYLNNQRSWTTFQE